MVSAIVLAAGSSRRMGNVNKLLLPFQDKTIIWHVVYNVLAAGLKEVIVVTGYESAAVNSALEGLPVQFVFNKDHTSGMTTSIQRGVLQAQGYGYMICLSDMVFISAEEYTAMAKNFATCATSDKKTISLPVYNGQKGNPVIFSSFYRHAILNHSEPEGCKAIIQSNADHLYLSAMATDHVLRDMDYIEQYTKLVT
ncbi:MAG: nucleotidyltransferase family protein [Chitinophagaceae bacterium]